jgi:hypothetical protein
MSPGEIMTPDRKEKILRTILTGELIESLYSLNIDYQKLHRQVVGSIDQIYDWKKKFINTQEALYDSHSDGIRIKVTGVESLEKTLVSEKFGLTGIVDMVLVCKIISHKNNQTTYLPLPFELKTGDLKDLCHKSQVMLYILMMYENDLKFAETVPGLLFYSRKDVLELVKVNGNYLFDILMKRNEIVYRNMKKNECDSGMQPGLGLIDGNFKGKGGVYCFYCENRQYCAAACLAKGQPKGDGLGLDGLADEQCKNRVLDYCDKWNSRIDALRQFHDAKKGSSLAGPDEILQLDFESYDELKIIFQEEISKRSNDYREIYLKFS